MRTYPDKPVDFDQAFELAEQHPMASELRKQIAAWIEPHTVNTRTDHSDAMLCVDIAYPLIAAYIAERERTVRDDPELAEPRPNAAKPWTSAVSPSTSTKATTMSDRLDAAIRARLEERPCFATHELYGDRARDANGWIRQGKAAIVAVLDRHKPGYPDGREYEEHDEPVFDRAGTPQGHVSVKGDLAPGYYCETCREFSPCETVKDVAEKLGVGVDDA